MRDTAIDRLFRPAGFDVLLCVVLDTALNHGGHREILSSGLLGYATLLCPFAGLAFGRPLTQAEIFGIAPDPTALACLGLLILVHPGGWGLPDASDRRYCHFGVTPVCTCAREVSVLV